MTTTEKKSIPAPVLKQASVEISPSFEDEADNKTEDEEFDETNANSEGLSFDFAKNLTQQFGITPGMSIQEQRQQRAEENGLGFA